MKDKTKIIAMMGACSVYHLHAPRGLEIPLVMLNEPSRGPRRKRGKGNKYHSQ